LEVLQSEEVGWEGDKLNQYIAYVISLQTSTRSSKIMRWRTS